MSLVHRIATALLLLAAALALSPADAGDVTNGGLVPVVQQRIREWLPDRDERRMDEIGWVRSLLEAERLGKKHERPVMLFTLDGRLDLGRC